MAALTLAEIWIYPVKSLGGLRLAAAQVLGKGLAYDRRWMLINEAGEFLTQRTLPQLALFQPAMDGQHLSISFGNDRVEVPKTESEGPRLQASVWGDTVWVVRASEAADRWFSRHLRQAVRLVHFPENSARAVDRAYAPESAQVSLADGYPYLVIGEASLRDLNQRTESPVPMNRFRPNFVVAGSEPYEEDRWNNFQVGSVSFRGVKSCARCVVITIDQQTGTAGAEPLATLATYRKQDGKVYLGRNALAATAGTVREGDKITMI